MAESLTDRSRSNRYDRPNYRLVLLGESRTPTFLPAEYLAANEYRNEGANINEGDEAVLVDICFGLVATGNK